jgi:ATP-dependent DNA ligase
MLGVYDQSKLRYVGHTGTGFFDEMLKDILQRLTPMIPVRLTHDLKPTRKYNGLSPS